MPGDAIDLIEYRYHAVGQGLFASGAFIQNGYGPRFRWVYDCGTVSGRKLIERELGRLPWLGWTHALVAQNEIEFVTISHFDADHISGLAKLLGRHRVETLLLPYMPLASRLLLAFGQGVGSADPLFRLFVDPVGYIASLDGGSNIGRIVMVPPTNGETVPMPPDRDGEPPGFVSEAPFALKADAEGFEPQSVDRLLGKPPGNGISVEILRPGGRLYLEGYWEFIPYNDGEARPADMVEFREEVERRKEAIMAAAEKMRLGEVIGRDLDNAIAALKSFYDDRIGGGARARNIISLFLYAGPLFDQSARRFRGRYRHHSSLRISAGRMGQLFTGDGYLDTPARLEAMVRYFGQQRMDRVGIFQVMHHGARANWHPGLADNIRPDVSIFSADPGRTSPGHPHAEVLRDFWRFGPIGVDCDRDFSIVFGRYR